MCQSELCPLYKCILFGLLSLTDFQTYSFLNTDLLLAEAVNSKDTYDLGILQRVTNYVVQTMLKQLLIIHIVKK
jgi:hypothetical protein